MWIASLGGTSALQRAGKAVRIDNDDIGGVVTGPRGPEAGVWVIAETNDLPTKFSRTVVTDDQGRYLVPDLPKANYSVWVRGYGLVDSPKVQAAPGRILNLTGVVGAESARGGGVLPGRLLVFAGPGAGQERVSGHGPEGNGISPNMKTQADWLRMMKTGGCTTCHQIGTKGTREIPAALGTFASGAAAWDRRVQSGQAGGQMSNGLNNMGRRRALAMFGDWTDRIAAGEVPPAPPRPQGVERNVVITQWDWADPKAYLHDVVSTDRRNPTGQRQRPDVRLARAERRLPARAGSDAAHRDAGEVDGARPEHAARRRATMPQPSPYWGDEADLDQQEQRAQPDDGRAGPRLDHVGGPPARQSRLLQGGLEPSLGEAVPDQQRRAASRDVRPEDAEAHAHQHLLRHAPPDVRRGRQPHALDERRRPGGRMAEHEDVRADGR